MAAEAERDDVIRTDELELLVGDGLVRAAGRAVVLSVREFELLVALVRREGRVVSREALYGLVWGGTLRTGDRSVDVYVHKLRVKLEQALPGRRFIHTHVGFGYRFQPEVVDGPSHDVHTTNTARSHHGARS